MRSKLAAGLFGIFLGGFGVHRFYLGYQGIGAGQLCLTVVGIILTSTFLGACIGLPCIMVAGVWGLVEGIMILTGALNRDAEGRPLAA